MRVIWTGGEGKRVLIGPTGKVNVCQLDREKR